jgi:hypothetical protein
MIHHLKCQKQFLQRISIGQKSFEIRKNDRDYQVGDELHLYQYDPDSSVQWYFSDTGFAVKVKVVYFTTAYQQAGYCVLGIELISEESNN